MSTSGDRSSSGIITHSKAPNRIIEYPDGAVHVSINRKQRGGYYVAMMVLPDGHVSASSKPQRKDAILAAAALGTTRRSTTARTSKATEGPVGAQPGDRLRQITAGGAVRTTARQRHRAWELS